MRRKYVLYLAVAIVAVWLWRSVTREDAPLRNGAYLAYDWGGSTVKVSFAEAGRGRYRASVEHFVDGEPLGGSPSGSQEIVTTRLRTEDGRVYELGDLGPLWIPPSAVKAGGSAHGDRVDEVAHWRAWDVGIVRANIGVGGALRGEWYYDKNTGFLVGGRYATAVRSGEGNVQ